jgi:hypothetical protein
MVNYYLKLDLNVTDRLCAVRGHYSLGSAMGT